MEGELLQELGVDIHSSFSFKDGDLILSSGNENLVQAISNRLNTSLNELDLFYDSDYGSVLSSFLGWEADDETLNYIECEVSNVLKEEPRLNSYELSIDYMGNGNLHINLILVTITENIVETNFVLTNDGVVEIEVEETDDEDEE